MRVREFLSRGSARAVRVVPTRSRGYMASREVNVRLPFVGWVVCRPPRAATERSWIV
jgi:hypothetical protein